MAHAKSGEKSTVGWSAGGALRWTQVCRTDAETKSKRPVPADKWRIGIINHRPRPPQSFNGHTLVLHRPHPDQLRTD